MDAAVAKTAADVCQIAAGGYWRLIDPNYVVNCVVAGDTAKGIVLGAILSILAWFAKSLLGFLTKTFKASRRRQDILRALEATIRESQRGYSESYSDARRDKLIERLEQEEAQGRAFVPYTSMAGKDFMLERVKRELEILPGPVVAAVTQYIYAVELIEASIADFRSDIFKTLATDRKKQIIIYVYALGQSANELGAEIVGKLAASKRHRSAVVAVVIVAIVLGLLYIAQRRAVHP